MSDLDPVEIESFGKDFPIPATAAVTVTISVLDRLNKTVNGGLLQ